MVARLKLHVSILSHRSLSTEAEIVQMKNIIELVIALMSVCK
jgi:hypothetical protein